MIIIIYRSLIRVITGSLTELDIRIFTCQFLGYFSIAIAGSDDQITPLPDKFSRSEAVSPSAVVVLFFTAISTRSP